MSLSSSLFCFCVCAPSLWFPWPIFPPDTICAVRSFRQKNIQPAMSDPSQRYRAGAPTPVSNSQPPQINPAPHGSWERPVPRIPPQPQQLMPYRAPQVPAGPVATQTANYNNYNYDAPSRYSVPGSQGPERLNQVAFLQNRIARGISPTAVTGLAAMLMQVETHAANPHHPVTLRVGHGPHALALTLHNLEWVGYDLT